jgi:hypothetical protein
LTISTTFVILEGMEILKEITQWEVSYRQPNHTYLVNNKGQIIAYAKWHSNDIMIFKTRDTLNKRYRKFEKSNHSGLSKLLSQFKNEDNQKETKSIFKPEKSENIRIFKVKSKGKDYIVEYNILGKYIICPCIGFSYRRKCKHSEAVAKKLQTA